MNARWSGHERTMVWTWTHDGLVTARWSGHERTKVWTWTHKKFSCFHFQTFVRSCPDYRALIRRKKKLPAGVQCRSLKLKTERVPKLHKSRYLKSFLREVHEHLYTNRRRCLFFAVVSKIQGVYLSVLRKKWTSNKIRLFWHSFKKAEININIYHTS